MRLTRSINPSEDAAVTCEVTRQFHLQLVDPCLFRVEPGIAIGQLDVPEALLWLVGVGVREFADGEFVVTSVVRA